MWDIRYRPLKFSDVLGQEGAVQVLKSRLLKGTALDTSYIFSGGHGIGKTTIARILARALLCQNLSSDAEPCNTCENCKAILEETSPAFTEKDAASQGTVDNVRAILEDLPYVLRGVPKRVYLFDEAHRMSRDAQDVLLKPIEDKRLVCMLCTTEPEKIRNAIRSRCEDYNLRRITREDIFARMAWVLQQEQVEFEENAVLTVIDYSGTHVRDALNRLEMLAQLGPVTTKLVQEHLNLSVTSTYYQVLLSLGEPSKALELVECLCDKVGVEDIYEGLAESAMNSYRLAHKMYVNFVFVDRDLAKKVHDLYGDQGTVDLARYFLGARHPSKTNLVCDVLSCASGLPSPSSAQPTRIALQVVPSPSETTLPAIQPEAAVVAQPEHKETAVIPSQLKYKEAVTSKTSLRSDGIGAPGSGDIFALTELDPKLVPTEMPRGSESSTKTFFEGSSDPDLLTPEQWRFEFLQA